MSTLLRSAAWDLSASSGPLQEKRKFWLFLASQGPRNTPLGGITSLCHISLTGTTGWLKPNEQAGRSARSPVVLLVHAPAQPYQRGGKVCERTRVYILLPAPAQTPRLEQGSLVLTALLRERKTHSIGAVRALQSSVL